MNPKILFLYPSWNNHVCGLHRDPFIYEVSKQTDCKLAGHGFPDYIENEKTIDTIHRLYGNDEPDWVVGCGAYIKKQGFGGKITSWDQDMHVNPHALCKSINENTDIWFTHCRYATHIFPDRNSFLEALQNNIDLNGWLNRGYCREVEKNYYVDRIKVKTFYFPYSLNPEKFKPSEEKKYDVSFLGSVGNFFPVRKNIWDNLPHIGKEKKWRVLLKSTPSARYRYNLKEVYNNPKLRESIIVGEDYAQALSKTKIFIFGCGILRRPVSKIFEGLMSGTLVMCTEPFHADEIHLKPDWNYIKITMENWQEKLEYYMDDDQLRETIARRGHETALKYHTNTVRAKEFIETLTQNKNGGI